MTKHASRLAPSPTGALHLGNARTFVVNWALARRHGWRLPLRIEDLDGPRVRPESIPDTLELLAWLGIDFDGAPTIQSDDLDPYRAAMRTITAQGLAYACALTRREIEAAASAPHAGDQELRFPSMLRPADYGSQRFEDETTNYRFVVPDETMTVDDVVAGAVSCTPAHEVGDFVIWTKRGVPSYQLAVVVDDARQCITDVVRGDDLLPSAARQTLLYRALDRTPPRWWHLPLVVGPDGRRLAKRHGDTRIATYRADGVRAERILGLLAWWSGVSPERRPCSAADFRDQFDLRTLSRQQVTFTADDHAWLTG